MLEQWQVACEQFQAEDSVDSANPGATNHHQTNFITGNRTNSTTGLNNNATVGSYDHLNGYSTIGRGSNAAMGSAFDALSDKDSVSLHAHSVTASHVEKTLSEVASSLSAPFPRPGPQDPAYTLMRIWLLTAELHLRQGRVTPEAEMCVAEARQLSPMSYHLMFVRGLIFEEKQDYTNARQCFENSLGINPSHVASLHHLGKVYHLLGFQSLAEQSLKQAVRIDPQNECMWSLLGDVQEAVAAELLTRVDEMSGVSALASIPEETEKTPTELTAQSMVDEAGRMFTRAAECHAIALALHATSPILPFTTVPMSFE